MVGMRILLLLFVVGCVESGAPTGVDGEKEPAEVLPTSISGTRIKAVYWETPDGARIFAGRMRDMQRDEECAPGVAADGVTRCLPSWERLNYSAFADNSCTIFGHVMSPSTAPPAYIGLVFADPGNQLAPQRVRMFSAGAKQTYGYDTIQGSCAPKALGPGNPVLYPAASEVASTEFVPMTGVTD